MTPRRRGLCGVGVGTGLLLAVLPYGGASADAAAVSAYEGASAYGSEVAYGSGAAYERGSTRSPEATHGPGRAHGRPGSTLSPEPGPGAKNDRVPSYPRSPSHVPAPTSPAGPASASSASSASPSRSSVPSVSSAGPDRAGSRAGEGRIRPGRTGEAAEADPEVRDEETAVAEEEGLGDEDGFGEEPTAEAPREAGLVPSASPHTVRRADAAEEHPVGRMLRILPLGSGLVLIGLGLGLAYVGLRLRRD